MSHTRTETVHSAAVPSDSVRTEAPRRWIRVSRYVIAVAITGLALALQIMALPFLPHSPLLFFYPAVIVVARYVGFGPGVLTTCLSIVFALRFVPGSADFVLERESHALNVAIFAGVSLLLTSLFESDRVSSRRAAEAIRAQEDANRAKDAVLAAVSHDLRNHFGAVSLSAAALVRQIRRVPDSTLSTETAERIQRAVKLADGLIVDLLDSAKLSAEGVQLEFRAHSPAILVREAVEVAALLSDAKSITLEAEVEATRRLLCDRSRTLRVLSNIIGNAIKFTPRGGTVRVSARDEGEWIAISVTDTGPGIPEEDLPRIFERYWKGRQHGAGTGLGLYIAKSIVAAHGGEIRVDTVMGKGATFEVTLPAAPELTAA